MKIIIILFNLKLLKKSSCELLEPLMFVEITTPEDKLSAVLTDLSSRRGSIQNVVNRGQQKVRIWIYFFLYFNVVSSFHQKFSFGGFLRVN